MPVSQAELESLTADLTTQAFETFADDIATMFDTEVSASQTDITTGTIEDIKDKFKKLAAVCPVIAEGQLNGQFCTIFDKEGLFTLAGTFVMQPAQIIAKNRKDGTEDKAKEIGDALAEVGNLMVGSWDRAFREENEDHGHFVQAEIYIGNPWTETEEKIGIKKDEELLILEFEMTVEPVESFKCAVIYPKSIFEAPPEVPEEPVEEEPAAEEPVTEEPAAEEPVAEEPVAEEQTTEDTAEEPATEEPVAEEQTAEDTTEEPVAEEQTTEEPAAEEQTDEPQPAAQAPEPQPTPTPVSQAIKNITRSQAVLPGQNTTPTGFMAAIKASDIMRTDVLWAGPDETVEQLVAKMQQSDCGYVLIGQNGVLEGIVSKADIRGAMSPYLQTMLAKWRTSMDLATLQIKAQWVMSRPVRTVRSDSTLWNLVKAMSDFGVRCFPIIDNDGKVKGTVTAFDVFNALLADSQNAPASGKTSQAPPLA